jgi:hypothetical protein
MTGTSPRPNRSAAKTLPWPATIIPASSTSTGTVQPHSRIAVLAAVKRDRNRKLAAGREVMQLGLEGSRGQGKDATLALRRGQVAAETLQRVGQKAAHRGRIAEHGVGRLDLAGNLVGLNAVLGEVAASALFPLSGGVPGLVQPARLGRGERQLQLHLLAATQQDVIHHGLDHLLRIHRDRHGYAEIASNLSRSHQSTGRARLRCRTGRGVFDCR